MKSYKNVDEYLDNFQGEVLQKLREIRKILKTNIPKNLEILEVIKYGIPTLVLKKQKKSINLIHFGGFKTHVSVFPGPQVIQEFKNDLTKYETSKGTIKFSIDKQIPEKLIIKILKFILWGKV